MTNTSSDHCWKRTSLKTLALFVNGGLHSVHVVHCASISFIHATSCRLVLFASVFTLSWWSR